LDYRFHDCYTHFSTDSKTYPSTPSTPSKIDRDKLDARKGYQIKGIEVSPRSSQERRTRGALDEGEKDKNRPATLGEEKSNLLHV
jgi:hypothetical protein